MTSYVSLNFRTAAYAQETGEVLIALLTIDHPSLEEPIRISTDPTERLSEGEQIVYGTKSNTKEFIFFPVRLKLPDDTDEGPRNMQIELDNIHRQYIQTIREIVGPPTMQVDIVLSSDPDTIETSWPEFLMRNIKYNAFIISATLDMETLEREPFPAGSFDPSRFRGLF